MHKSLLKDLLGWGTLLWLIGYILGFVFFFIVPPNLVGWAITPIGTIITLWVLFKKIDRHSLHSYLTLSIAWTVLAMILDYFFIVQLLKPADGYYKLDVYVYYILTFTLPLMVGWWKQNQTQKTSA